MCEFCSFGGQDRDSRDLSFAGFFCDSAINAAIQQAKILRRRSDSTSDDEDSGNEDDDSDGT